MHAQKSLVVAAFAVVGALGVAAFGQDSSDRHAKKVKKPTKVDIVTSIPLSVTVTGTPLPVSIATLPPVEVSALPNVTVAALPNVTVATLPPVTVTSLPAVEVATLPAVNVAT